MKKCPFCAEDILDDAIKCKHCGSDLSKMTVTMSTVPPSYGKSDYIKYILLALLLPVVGLIIGIVFITKPTPQEKKMGESIIAWSILFMITWGILWFWYSPSLIMSAVVIPSSINVNY